MRSWSEVSAGTRAWLWWARLWREATLKGNAGLGKEATCFGRWPYFCCLGHKHPSTVVRASWALSPTTFPPTTVTIFPSWRWWGQDPSIPSSTFSQDHPRQRREGNKCQHSGFGVLNAASLGLPLATTILIPFSGFHPGWSVGEHVRTEAPIPLGESWTHYTSITIIFYYQLLRSRFYALFPLPD